MKYLSGQIVLFFWMLHAYLGALDIQKIGVQDGLTNNNIVGLTQDKEGFLWIATKDGLNRFDAHRFKAFKTSDEESNSICSNALNDVYADKNDDVVWIATEKNGIDAYNYKTDVFTHYEHDYTGQNPASLMANGVTQLTGDEEGNLWLATYMAGVDCFDKESGTFTHYNQSNVQGLGSDYNWCILYESKERIYVGHVSQGFSILNTVTRTAKHYQANDTDVNSLPHNTVSVLFKDSDGRIWLGTRDGLVLFNPESGAMQTFKNIPGNRQSLSNNFIQSIEESDKHELWIGTEGGGINVLDLKELGMSGDIPSKVRFSRLQASDTPDGLSGSIIRSLYKDSYGNMWIGALGSGLNFIPRIEPFFRKINYLPLIGNENSLDAKMVPGLCTDDQGNVWVANAQGGINIFRNGKKIRHIQHMSGSDEPLNVSCVYNDQAGRIWLATGMGEVFYYTSKTGRFTEIFPQDIHNLPIYHLFKDSNHNLWMTSDAGLQCYHIPTGEQKFYTTRNSEIRDDNIRVVAEDNDRNIWVGTLGGGLSVFDDQFNLMYDFGRYFDFYSIKDLHKDALGRMWVASQNDLFVFKNKSTDSVLRIGKKQGLTENYIRSLCEGKSANEMWVSTTNGISHVLLDSLQVDNFNVSDNIMLGDYLPGSVTKTSDGFVYFGSQNGITWFHEELQQMNNSLACPVFTDFLTTSVQANNLNEFERIPFVNAQHFEHDQNSFQIHFNVLDYSLSNKVEFAFQLQGLDNGWYLIGKDKQVTFRNLKPGNYTFNLKSRLHNKEWSSQLATLQWSIAPPFWLSPWAKVLYIILFIVVNFLFIRFYQYKLKMEKSLVFEKFSRQQEHDLNEEKIKFFTNITHELRTPMTLILGPLEDLISDKSLSAEQATKLASIHRVANRLLHLINQILEFRKSTHKSRKLRVLKDDFVKFVNGIGVKYQELQQNKNIEFKVSMPDSKLEMFFDPEVVTIILDNLLSNAFKYTQQGVVRLRVRNFMENNIDYTELSVSDTGFGISEHDLPHIFERYYQAKKTSYPVTGTGIGLSLVKNMVELHEAEIKVASMLNEGTKFTVRFVTNNTYPDVIHVDTPRELPEEQPQSNDDRKVILLVDDNQEIIDYIKDSLVDTYKVFTAENGKVGWEKASEKVPDLVISDVMMPVMDGIELCKTMKQDVRTSHIPVILLSAKDALQDQSEGYDAGADSYLTKPFSSSLLRSRVKNILEAHQKLYSDYTSDFKHKQKSFNESINQLDKEFLDNLTKVIEDNLEDETLNISQVALQLNMSHSTLYRKIKALTNLTANEYIRKVRIRVAEQLLLTNQYNISEIMYKIGINSSSYFRRCFKEEFGMNPSEYLQKLKQE